MHEVLPGSDVSATPVITTGGDAARGELCPASSLLPSEQHVAEECVVLEVKQTEALGSTHLMSLAQDCTSTDRQLQPEFDVSQAQLWELMTSHGNISISVVDRHGVYQYLSPHLLAHFGITKAQMLGRSIRETMSSAAGQERVEIVCRVLDGGRPALLLESATGVPLRTVVTRMVERDGRELAVCFHHLGEAAGEMPLDSERYEIITPLASEVSPLAQLSSRELEVLRLIAMGDSQAEIARKIHRTVKTVEWHRASLGRKLGVNSRVELARLAVRYGVVREGHPLPNPITEQAAGADDGPAA